MNALFRVASILLFLAAAWFAGNPHPGINAVVLLCIGLAVYVASSFVD